MKIQKTSEDITNMINSIPIPKTCLEGKKTLKKTQKKEKMH